MPSAADPPPTYSFGLAARATRQVDAMPWLRALADPGDLLGAANLAWAESAQRWDPVQASLSTYAWRRMHGRVRDCLRSERRFRRLQRRVAAAEPATCFVPAWTEPLALRQAIETSRPAMTPTEQIVLQRVYGDGGTLVEVAEARGASIYCIERAHQRLLERLRGAVAGKVAGREAPEGLRRDLAVAPPEPAESICADAPGDHRPDVVPHDAEAEPLEVDAADWPW